MSQPCDCHRNDILALIAVGSNATSRHGTPFYTAKAAVTRINRAPFRVVSTSRFFETPCFPAGAGDDYINAVVAIRTQLWPHDVLDMLHQIEAEFDRERIGRWASRTLDLDLIDHNGTVLPDPTTHDHWRNLTLARQKHDTPDGLILPHPRIQDRAFVLVPMSDIAPDWTHPVLGQSCKEMLAKFPAKDIESISAVTDPLQTRQDTVR